MIDKALCDELSGNLGKLSNILSINSFNWPWELKMCHMLQVAVFELRSQWTFQLISPMKALSRRREREGEKHCSIWLASHCDILTGEACVLANLCSSQQENWMFKTWKMSVPLSATYSRQLHFIWPANAGWRSCLLPGEWLWPFSLINGDNSALHRGESLKLHCLLSLLHSIKYFNSKLFYWPNRKWPVWRTSLKMLI